MGMIAARSGCVPEQPKVDRFFSFLYHLAQIFGADMGFRISWVGFKAVDKPALLAHLGFRDTGAPDEANEAPFSLAVIPTGWVILFSNDFDFAPAEHLIGLSAGMSLVACQVHEGIMFSSAHGYENRQEQWGVWHDGGDAKKRDLKTTGHLPSAFTEIRQRLLAQQDADDKRQVALPLDQQNGGAAHGNGPQLLNPNTMAVDYLFDIPVDLAEAMTGYRHDRLKFSWGEPRFTIIERAAG